MWTRPVPSSVVTSSRGDDPEGATVAFVAEVVEGRLVARARPGRSRGRGDGLRLLEGLR